MSATDRGGRWPARITVVGAGGLGGPIAFALAAAGVELTIIDDDRVEGSNLHRQLQFTAADLGAPKAVALRAALIARGATAVTAHVARWSPEAADELGGDAEVIIDGTDDPMTKFAIADAAVADGRPYVIAAALRYGGTIMIGAPGAACYRCLFEEPPADGPTCADAGVLGPVVAAIGGVAAAAALALLRGDRRDAGTLLAFEDVRTPAEPRRLRFGPRRGCPACARAAIPPGRADASTLLADRGPP
jgi:adenylyltransferase/sulfurtransferase